MSGRNYDVVTLARKMGLNTMNAQMVVPQMWLMAATCDPYSPVTIMMVEALQYKLATMGYANRGDGFIDKHTAAALATIAGPHWQSKTWAQIYGDVLWAETHGVPAKGLSGMGYTAMGGLSTSDWCSSKNPVCPNPLKGIVKPMTVNAANTFKLVQQETNRVAHMTGTTKIAVDGRIGPGTLSAVNAALKKGVALIGWALPGYPTVEDLAASADVVHVALSNIANSLNAPTVVLGPAAPHPSGAGGQLNPSNADIMADMPLFDRLKIQMSGASGMLLIGATIVGGLVYYNMKKTGKKPPIVKKVQSLLM